MGWGILSLHELIIPPVVYELDFWQGNNIFPFHPFPHEGFSFLLLLCFCHYVCIFFPPNRHLFLSGHIGITCSIHDAKDWEQGWYLRPSFPVSCIFSTRMAFGNRWRNLWMLFSVATLRSSMVDFTKFQQCLEFKPALYRPSRKDFDKKKSLNCQPFVVLVLYYALSRFWRPLWQVGEP